MDENVVIPDEKYLELVKDAMEKDGAKRLHVIADFDRTLTRAFVNGEKIPSIISILRSGEYLSKEYAEKAHKLYEKYHPIEINPDIPLNEKKKAMQEWWTTHFDLMIEGKLNKKDIEKVIQSDRLIFREGALEFLDMLHENEIPLVIMSSSGLGEESISLYLKRHKKLYQNIYIISNSFVWDKKGYALEIKKPIIHVMNKDETLVQGTPAFVNIMNRKNALLLGDSLGDTGMIEGFQCNNLIKIGFLNEDVEKNMKEYVKNYDVLILNDSSMEYVNTLLKEIVK